MSNRQLSILLFVLLFGGIVLAAGVLVVGPDSVESQTVELYEADQELLAEQGAMRIWETIRDVEVRLVTSISHQEAWLDAAQSRDKLREALVRLSHPSDTEIGIALGVLNERGKVLAVEPGLAPERAEVFASHVHGTPDLSKSVALDTCSDCLSGHSSLLVTAVTDHGRILAASIDLERLTRRIFEQMSRSRSTYVALLDADNDVVYAVGDQHLRSQGKWVVGHAQIPDTGLRLEIAAPRSVIAPEVRARVRGLLYTTYGVLGFLLACIGVFVLLKRRQQREHLDRVRSLAHQDKLATLGMMAASTAHEIRNAISVASLQLHVASSTDDLADKNTHLAKAATSVDRLGKLAESLSGYAGKGETTPERFELSTAVDEALGVVQPKVPSSIEVQVGHDEPLDVFGSRGAIVQVVVNLVLNAIDALQNRGEGGRVRVHTRGEDGRAILSVTDNGEGIEPGALDNIFKPFFSTKNGEDGGGGTGIGLWLCSQIIEQHNGSIDAENIATGGARFIVRLPLEMHSALGGLEQAEESCAHASSA